MTEEVGYDNEITSPNKSGKKPKSDSPQTLIPITIKEIHEIEQGLDDHFKLHGVEVQLVKLVARVVQIQTIQNTVSLSLEDGTGFLEFKLWKLPLPENVTVNCYVRIHGLIRQWDQKNSIVANSIRKVEDFNEITHHNLSVALHYYQIQNPQPKSSTQKKLQYDDMDLQEQDDLALSETNFNPIQQNVMKILKSSNDPIGVSFEKMINLLGDSFSQEQIKDAILSLFEDGHIFSLKEDYFKVTVDK